MTGAGPHNIWAETKGAPFVQVEEDQRGGSNYSLQVFNGRLQKKNEVRLFAGTQGRNWRGLGISLCDANSDCME